LRPERHFKGVFGEVSHSEIKESTNYMEFYPSASPMIFLGLIFDINVFFRYFFNSTHGHIIQCYRGIHIGRLDEVSYNSYKINGEIFNTFIQAFQAVSLRLTQTRKKAVKDKTLGRLFLSNSKKNT